jgi:hypothetical protein
LRRRLRELKNFQVEPFSGRARVRHAVLRAKDALIDELVDILQGERLIGLDMPR